jgi:hypothetical protein
MQCRLIELHMNDCGRCFESFRTLEWQIVFQTYAGFVAIAVGYSTVLHSHGPWYVFGIIGLLAAGGSLAATIYMGNRIQERLKRNQERRILLFAEAVNLLGPLRDEGTTQRLKDLLDAHSPGAPLDQGVYASRIQLWISIGLAAGLAAYIVATTWCGIDVLPERGRRETTPPATRQHPVSPVEIGPVEPPLLVQPDM